MRLRSVLLAAAVLLVVPCGVRAQTTVKRFYTTPNARIANVIWVGDTLYLSGMGAKPITPADPAKGTPAVWGDTQQQTEGALTAIQAALKDQGLTMGDIVEMQVFMTGDPAKGGALDFAGMNAAYAKFFGTPEQPNRPVRAAGLQLEHLGNPNALVEIMTIAVRSGPDTPVAPAAKTK
jgi:enamine deaminase RidA (YjgF/YER057c/UK114 family)